MKWFTAVLGVCAALVITTVAIDASDTLRGISGTLLGQVIQTDTSACPDGMVFVKTALTFSCVDMYEASVGETCPHQGPANEIESRENVEQSSCAAAAVAGVDPWRFLTREQAALACTRAGKRLPKSEEWHQFAAGTPDNAGVCNIDSGSLAHTGTRESCVSAHGVYDSIGNVWEWTTDDVISGVYQGRQLPAEGYVTQVDSSGVATLTDTKSASSLFYNDYLWTSPEGSYGILRGGFYGSDSDAGIYAVHARTVPTAVGTAIGFRCVQ